MGEPAFFAIIRGGMTRYYMDQWSGEVLHRDLVWGPEALEQWIVTLEETDEFDESNESAVVVNFDRKQLTYRVESDAISIPKIGTLYQRLLTNAWPDYGINWVVLDEDLLDALGDRSHRKWAAQSDYARIEYRHQSVAEAAGHGADDDEDDYQDDADTRYLENKPDSSEYGQADDDDGDEFDDQEDPSEFDETETRAWITVISLAGSVEHRQLGELPQDLLQGNPSAVEQLSELPACEIPPELVVHEGMWIDIKSKSVSLWGGPGTQCAMPIVESSWQGWNVQWASRGYVQQCEAAGPAGNSLSTEQALAQIVPTLLSVDRQSIDNVIAMFGGAVKRTAIRATGCLLFVLCLPIIIFGLVSGSWKPVGITIGITVALTFVAFKMVELTVKKKFKQGIGNMAEESDAKRPPTAGPLDPKQRRTMLNQLFQSAGLPALNRIDPYFPTDGWLR